jgi:hypothetical protein
LLPKHIISKKNRTTSTLEQENKDAQKLSDWKKALKRQRGKCPNEVRDYLDIELPGWRDDTNVDEKSMEIAIQIVKRAKERVINGGMLIPKTKRNKKNRTTPELEQEHKDALKLSNWKQALKGKGNRTKCSDEIRDYLDIELPGWRYNLYIDDNEKQKEQKKKKSMKLVINNNLNPKETTEQKRERTKSKLSILHQQYKTLKSCNLQQMFKETPQLWNEYHQIVEENEQTYPEDGIPRNRIIQQLHKIKTKRTKEVVDMGCGKAQIALHFKDDNRFHFTNYDHISSNELITECDISSLPLDDNSVEICILSLAMWGSNCHDYIKEANRILESNGKLYIIEPTKRWTEKQDQVDQANKLRELLTVNGFSIVEESIDKFALFMCVKVV